MGERPGLLGGSGVITRTGVAKKSVVGVRELDVHKRLAGLAQSFSHRLCLLGANVVVQATPEQKLWRVQIAGG